MIQRIKGHGLHTCYSYCLWYWYHMRNKFDFDVKLFFGFARDSFAFHFYVYNLNFDCTSSYVPKRSSSRSSFIGSLLRSLAYIFPHYGDLVVADGDFYLPRLFSDLHCYSISLIRSRCHG